MPAPLFIGDEVSATGFRLAGVRVRTPVEDEVEQVVKWACGNVSIIMITSAYMLLLPKVLREQLVKQETPPVVVVPDIRNQTPVDDLVTQLHKTLGFFE